MDNAADWWRVQKWGQEVRIWQINQETRVYNTQDFKTNSGGFIWRLHLFVQTPEKLALQLKYQISKQTLTLCAITIVQMALHVHSFWKYLQSNKASHTVHSII